MAHGPAFHALQRHCLTAHLQPFRRAPAVGGGLEKFKDIDKVPADSAVLVEKPHLIVIQA